MPVSLAELQHAAELKRGLVQFALGPECDQHLRHELAQYQRLHDIAPGDNNETITADFLDTFINYHRFENNETVTDLYLRATPDLPAEDRLILESWKGIVEGVFHIQRRAQDTLIATNLVDELTYAIRSNQVGGTRQFLPGMYLVARIVPLGDEWVLSGSIVPLPASDRRDAYQTALHYATTRPDLVFRNPKLLEKGWESQTTQRNLFIKCFEGDTVIVAPGDYKETVRKFQRFVAHAVAVDAQEEQDLAEGAESGEIQSPEWLDDTETVALVYDEHAGNMVLPDYAMLIKAFETPELAKESPYKDAVLEYVEEPDLPSAAFRRLAVANPSAASRVLQLAYDDPELTWEGDGERLLRDNRGGQDDTPTVPSVLVVNEELVKIAYGEDEPVRIPARRLPGRNDPCPCGSGQKYKRCCGR